MQYIQWLINIFLIAETDEFQMKGMFAKGWKTE